MQEKAILLPESSILMVYILWLQSDVLNCYNVINMLGYEWHLLENIYFTNRRAGQTTKEQ